MSVNLAALLYLVSGALFIMALRGLSSPATSRQGNLYGMVGMTIAILTTLATMHLSPLVIGLTVLGLAIGGGIGGYAAKNIAMTAMPQLVAAFHSLVGLAAVFVAAAAFYRRMPSTFCSTGRSSPSRALRCRWVRRSVPSPSPDRSSPS